MSVDSGWLPYVVLVLLVVVPALVGSWLVFVAVRRWLMRRTLAAAGQRATAKVVDNQPVSWFGKRMTFRPVVTFRAGSGRDVKTVLADLGGFRSHVVGAEIDVFYDPQLPAKAAPVRMGGTNLVTTLVFGLVFLVYALWWIVPAGVGLLSRAV